jgi:hypothetical protein
MTMGEKHMEVPEVLEEHHEPHVHDHSAPWLNYLALCTVLLALFATLAEYETEETSRAIIVSQNQATDQWAFYQSKAIKADLYDVQRELLQTELDTMPSDAPASTRLVYERRIAEVNQKIKQFMQDKGVIMRQAKALEQRRDDADHHIAPFALSVIFLQVSILIASISGLFKRKIIWYCSLPIGLIGIVFFSNGFYGFF